MESSVRTLRYMELHSEVIVYASAPTAWLVLGERFGQIGDWAAPIVTSTLEGELGVGAVRTCRFDRFGPFAPGLVKERLLAFDPTAMSLVYESVAGMPSFVESAVNRWSVQPYTATTCRVRTHATLQLRGPVRLLGPLLQRMLEAGAARVLEELRHQVEHGRPHPRKRSAAYSHAASREA